MSRSRAALGTWLTSLIFVAATMLTGFVITPWVLGRLGNGRFGIGRTLTETVAYMTIVTQGITVAMVPLLAGSIGRGDRGSLHRTLSAGFRVYFLSAAAFFLFGLALTPFLGQLFKVDVGPALVPFLGQILDALPGPRAELRMAWLVCLAGVPLAALAPMKILIEVANKGYIANLLIGAQSLLTAALSVLLVWAGMGVVGLMLAILIASVAYNVAVTAVALRLNPGLLSETLAARPTRGDWKALLALSGPTLVAMLGERIGTLSDSIVLSTVLGTAAATQLFLTQRLASLGQMLLNGISGAIWPSLAEMHARGERHGFNVRLAEITRLAAVLGVAGLAPVLAFNPHFVARWVGPSHDGGRLIVLVVSANAILLGLIHIYNQALVSTGHVGRLAYAAALSAVLNLILSVLLTYWLGLIGPILGTLCSYLVVQTWYVPMQLRRTFGTPLRGLFRAAASPIAWGVPFALGLIALADAHTPPGWFALIGEMGIASIAFLAFAFAVILSPGDRDLWRARLITPLARRLVRRRLGATSDELPPAGMGSPVGP